MTNQPITVHRDHHFAPSERDKGQPCLSGPYAFSIKGGVDTLTCRIAQSVGLREHYDASRLALASSPPFFETIAAKRISM